jgi:hypothetical protein
MSAPFIELSCAREEGKFERDKVRVKRDARVSRVVQSAAAFQKAYYVKIPQMVGVGPRLLAPVVMFHLISWVDRWGKVDHVAHKAQTTSGSEDVFLPPCY